MAQYTIAPPGCRAGRSETEDLVDVREFLRGRRGNDRKLEIRAACATVEGSELDIESISEVGQDVPRDVGLWRSPSGT